MTTTADAEAAPEMRDPSGGGGLLDVFRRRYLLRLLVRKEVKVRYQGSVLGFGWSYAQPAMRFFVYFVVIGLILGLDRRVPNFPVHIFAGMTMVHLFSETFASTTRSVVKNKSLVRKVGLPREMFPVASLFVSMVNVVPGLIILFVVAVFTGWHPTWHLVPSAVLAVVIVTVWAFAVGLLFSAFNVYYRDFSKVVQVVTTLVPWSTPMIYSWDIIRERLSEYSWALDVWLANPCAEAVMLMQQAIWVPTLDQTSLADSPALDMPPYLYARGLVMVAIGLCAVWFSQKAFTRLESSFAEQL